MAYPEVEPACELINSRTGVAFGRRGARSFERNFLVKTTNPFYGPNEICQATNFPSPYSIYSMDGGADSDATAVMVEASARLIPQSEDDNRYWWIATAKYSNDVPDEGIPALTFMGSVSNGSQSLPWMEPPMVRYEYEVLQRAEPNDLDGLAYNNSAQQPFTPPFTTEKARRILVMTRNQQNFDFNSADEYSFATNSDDFTPPGSTIAIAPGGAQCFPISAEHAQRGNVGFWRVSYRVRIGAIVGYISSIVLGIPVVTQRRESFNPVRILDAGMCRLQDVSGRPGFGTPVPIFSATGHPISQPVLLDGNGQQAVQNAVGVIVPRYIERRPFPSKPFTPIVTVGIGGP